MQVAPVAKVCGPSPRSLERISKTSFHASQPVCIRAPRTVAGRCRQTSLVVRADRDRGSGFVTGFVLGGTIFGALGFLFAPQISSALLGDDQKLRLPRFLEGEADPQATKDNLRDKIAQLNAAIDEISGQLSDRDQEPSNSAAVKETTNA